MKRVLVFDGSVAAASAFATIHKALRFGRNQQTTAPGRDVLRRERDIVRALQTIGTPDKTQSEDVVCRGCGRVALERDPKALALQDGGGTVTLTQAEVELIQERIDKGFWSGDLGVEMADALDFLGAAPEHKDPAPEATA